GHHVFGLAGPTGARVVARAGVARGSAAACAATALAPTLLARSTLSRASLVRAPAGLAAAAGVPARLRRRTSAVPLLNDAVLDPAGRCDEDRSETRIPPRWDESPFDSCARLDVLRTLLKRTTTHPPGL